MGYETTLIFVESYQSNTKRIKGFQNVVGSVEMCKVAYHAFGKLLDEKTAEVKAYLAEHKNIESDLKELDKLRSNLTGDWGNDKTQYEPVMRLEEKLGKLLPYIFWTDSERERFDDSYGAVFAIASLEEVRQAIIQDMATNVINKDYGNTGYYWRYDLAIGLIDAIQKYSQEAKCIKVVLWGH